MTSNWLLLFILIIPINLILKWFTDKSKDFTNSIESALKKQGLKFTHATVTYPGLFKVGPFKKFEISIGKPTINNGAIRYENSYYRIVKVQRENANPIQLWAKIDTSWFKETKIEFQPKISAVKNHH